MAIGPDTFDIETIVREPDGRAHDTPLLFIHGVFSSAHIWEPFFLPFFADRGYRSVALSLRGHGGSGGRENLSAARLRDYVVDLERVVDGLGATPVLIGHSLGGMVAQHFMARRSVPAAVLMASGPPHGMSGSAMQMLFAKPALFRDMTLLQTVGPSAATLEGARRALFRDETPEEYIRRVLPEAQPESHLAALDAMGLDLPPSRRRTDIPVLVIGGDKDPFVSRVSLEMTALTFGTRAEIIPGMPHALMLDPEWEVVARRMANWLDAALREGAGSTGP